MQSISILGSTGSIGTQVLEVIRENPSKFKIDSLACKSEISLLKKQIKEFNPKSVVVFDKYKAIELMKEVDIEVLYGMEGLIKLSKKDSCDVIVNSLVGSVGILPTVEAIKSKKDVLLANKETLVVAGKMIFNLAKENGVSLKPIDSEHSAIFQCLNGESKGNVKRLILTCSGGAFRDRTREEMQNLRASDALKHPNWEMGRKITIDCATLMNKGFEVIEANILFGINYDNIEVVIHPQSIIHSLVEFVDTSIISQLGIPNMKIPIQYALSHPSRFKNNLESLDLTKVSNLSFNKPDLERFPCLKYAYDAGRQGGTMPCVMNAANEIAVNAFLEGKIKFLDIARIIKEAMDKHDIIKNPKLDEIIKLDKKIKEETRLKILNTKY